MIPTSSILRRSHHLQLHSRASARASVDVVPRQNGCFGTTQRPRVSCYARPKKIVPAPEEDPVPSSPPIFSDPPKSGYAWEADIQPDYMNPKNVAEEAYFETLRTANRLYSRKWERDSLEDRARGIHLHTRRYGINRYANVRFVAGQMIKIEGEDFMLEDKAPRHLSSWSRAELKMEEQFDVFDAYLRETLPISEPYGLEEQEQDMELEEIASEGATSRNEVKTRLAKRLDQQDRDIQVMEWALNAALPGMDLATLAQPCDYNEELEGIADAELAAEEG